MAVYAVVDELRVHEKKPPTPLHPLYIPKFGEADV
jgi:hypothetical protein